MHVKNYFSHQILLLNKKDFINNNNIQHFCGILEMAVQYRLNNTGTNVFCCFSLS